MGCRRIITAAKAEVFCSQNQWCRYERDDAKQMKAIRPDRG